MLCIEGRTQKSDSLSRVAVNTRVIHDYFAKKRYCVLLDALYLNYRRASMPTLVKLVAFFIARSCDSGFRRIFPIGHRAPVRAMASSCRPAGFARVWEEKYVPPPLRSIVQVAVFASCEQHALWYAYRSTTTIANYVPANARSGLIGCRALFRPATDVALPVCRCATGHGEIVG